MPKDPTRNIDRYKIRGGQLNAFEFARNQAAMAQEQRERFERQQEARRLREGEFEIPPPTEAERVTQLLAAHEQAMHQPEPPVASPPARKAARPAKKQPVKAGARQTTAGAKKASGA